MWGTEVRRKARNDSQPRSTHEIEGDFKEAESFRRPAQGRGGTDSRGKPLAVDLVEVFAPCPGRTWPPWPQHPEWGIQTLSARAGLNVCMLGREQKDCIAGDYRNGMGVNVNRFLAES